MRSMVEGVQSPAVRAKSPLHPRLRRRSPPRPGEDF